MCRLKKRLERRLEKKCGVAVQAEFWCTARERGKESFRLAG